MDDRQQQPYVQEDATLSDLQLSELGELFDFFAAHLSELRAMPATFGSVRRGLPLVVDADDLVSIVLSRMADLLVNASSQHERASRSEKYRTLGYVYRAMENEAIDRARRSARQQPWQDSLLEDADHAVHAESPILSTSASQDLAVIICALRQRARRDVVPPTCITDIHASCLEAIETGHGSQTALALRLGVDDSRISQIKKQAISKIKETIYIAGVLGPADGLSRPASIDASLDVYDGVSARVHTPGDRARLTVASGCVYVGVHGQRADARLAAMHYLLRADKRQLRVHLDGANEQENAEYVSAFVADLHRCEIAQADSCGVDHPNCCIACSRHNPDRYRVIWEVDVA